MVFIFLALTFLSPFAWLFAEGVFKVLLWVVNRNRVKEKSLLQMFEDGDLKTDVPMDQQYVLLGAVDEDDEEVAIEALDDEFDIVDIERYKRAMRSKQMSSEIVFEI